jgi:hypothetical protein
MLKRLARMFVLFCAALALSAQFGGEFREAIRLDLDGNGAEARRLLENAIQHASTPREKANAERAMAMSPSFIRRAIRTPPRPSCLATPPSGR